MPNVQSTVALCTLSLALLACSASDDEPDKPTDQMPSDQTTSETTTEDPSSEDRTSNSDDTSLGAPAPCETDADCPEGIACVTFVDPATGQESSGHCDVDEHTVVPTESGGTSLGAPAMCETDADCPEGIACVSFDDGPGFCDVAEMIAE